jgi:hypothetical protein
MVKRKCGTCRHFKDGGIAGSGWCQHQARKDIQHMVLVRKTELACRNSWDQDLWELADRPIDIQTSTHIPMPVSGGEPQDIPVARVEASADDAGRAGEMFTDKITSISMPTRSQLRPSRVEAEAEMDDAASAELQDARSSVREARKRRQEQRHLERRKHQETVLQRADDLLDTRNPDDPTDESIARVRASDGPLTTKHNERPQSPRSNEEPPQPRPEVARPTRREEPVPSIEFAATPQRFGAGTPRQVPTKVAEPAAKPGKDASNGVYQKAKMERGETEPLPSAAEVRDAVKKQREQPQLPPAAPQKRPTTARAESRSEVVAFKRADPPADLPPAVEERPTNWFTGAGNIARPPVLRDAPAPFPVDPIDLSRDLKTVRRCCATCRDFKQVGDGRTGWCNNPYAFPEKRMVQSNEIACRSSLGVWWLPHDELWLEYADTTHHGRPTPLLDEMLGAVPAERQGMGQRSSR